MNNASELTIALLVDAENISEKYIGAILDELASNYGKVTYRRIYGDWSSTSLSKWKESAVSLALTPIQQFSIIKNKNASDSAMIIDAMDILYTAKVDAFCIVSSDSDFTRLATRLRESAKRVIGMGERKTSTTFKHACDKFITLENLLPKSPLGAIAAESPVRQLTEDETAILTKILAIASSNCDDDGWASLADLGNILAKQVSDFDTRDYGANSLSAFVKKYDWIIDIRAITQLNSAILYYIKFKSPHKI